MALGASSLSLAIQGFADFLADSFPEDVTITVDTPQRASETAKNAGAGTDILNVFIYRIAPSGFHADLSANRAGFIRAYILLTPFPRAQDDHGATDLDLKVLGHALAVLQSNPVVPLILPAAPGSPAANALAPETTFYQLQCILQAPGMEELNHIWTTQGGDLAYRISAAYELALIPVEPLAYVAPPVPVTAAVLDVRADATPGLSDTPLGVPPPGGLASWVPVLMFRDGAALANSMTVAPGTASVDLALAGLPGEKAEITVAWTRSGGVTEDAKVKRNVQTGQLDAADAAISVPLDNAADGDTAVIFARPEKPGKATPGNRLMLTVGGV